MADASNFGHKPVCRGRPTTRGAHGARSRRGTARSAFTMKIVRWRWHSWRDRGRESRAGWICCCSRPRTATSVVLHKSLPYNVGHDFAPVAMFGGAPSLLMAAPQITTVADLIAARRQVPVKLSSAQSGSVPLPTSPARASASWQGWMSYMLVIPDQWRLSMILRRCASIFISCRSRQRCR